MTMRFLRLTQLLVFPRVQIPSQSVRLPPHKDFTLPPHEFTTHDNHAFCLLDDYLDLDLNSKVLDETQCMSVIMIYFGSFVQAPKTKVPSTYFQIETYVHEVQVLRGQPRIAVIHLGGGVHAAEDAKLSLKPEHFISRDVLYAAQPGTVLNHKTGA